MSKFKRCHVAGCPYVATKRLRLWYPNCDEKLGGWKRYIGEDSIMIQEDKIYKHTTVKVCKICYENAIEEDFTMTLMTNERAHPSRIERL